MVNASGSRSGPVRRPRPALRLSLPQQRLQRVPSIRRRTHASQRFQPFLGMVDFEDIHPAGSAVVERSFQQTGA
jgi:hypothetical protein